MTSSGTPAPVTGGDAFLTRRELRAREAAAVSAVGSGAADSDNAAESAPEAGIPVIPVNEGTVASVAGFALSPVASASASATRLSQPAPAAQPSPAPRPKPGPPPVRPKPAGRNPIKVLVTLVAIPGIFLTAALPAYAFAPNGEVVGGASASRSLSTSEAQGITLAGGATLTVARDGFTATTKEELEERDRQAKRAEAVQRAAEAAAASSAASARYAVRGVRAEGDDYPWPYAQTDNGGGGLSPLGYYYRECVDFVAWRLNRDAGSSGSPWAWTWSNLTPGGGSASSWKSQWDRHGWATSDAPVVGAVAWFNYNHVAYVQSIPGDGTVVLEEYNWMGSHAYHTRVVSADSVPKYLYPPF